MKSFAVVLFLGVVALLGLTQAAEDYCDKSLCSSGEKHIACNHSGDFAKSCHASRKLIKIDDALKKVIVDLHNTLRNEIAGGKVSGYEGATRMASMQWDDELAKLAELHSKNCEFEHDDCHNTKTYKYSGQNLAQSWTTDTISNYKEVLDELIRSWFDEKKDASMEVIKNYPRNWSGDDIGHFTEMVQEGNNMVGCGLLFMIDDDMNSVMLTCDYAKTNMINKPVYEAGKPASKCTTSTNPLYKNLCSTKETY